MYKFNISIYISCIININIIHRKKYIKFVYVPQEIPYIDFKYVYADIGHVVYDASSRMRKEFHGEI